MQQGHTLETWNKFAAFEVFGDYAPMSGFRLVVKVAARPDSLTSAISSRAQDSDLLDPALAQWVVRAGLGLAGSGLVSFVYATVQDVVCVVRPDVVQGEGAPLRIQGQLLTQFTARLALLAGRELGAAGTIYEFPDVTVIRKAITRLAADFEESTPLRSSHWLGAQLQGRGQPFHPSMLESLEEQTSLLQSNGIDMDALPAWWWKGIAAAVGPDGQIAVIDELPGGDALGELIPE